MDAIAIITTSAAVWGAGLSTVLAVQRFHDRMPHIYTTVTLGTAELVSQYPQRVVLHDGRAGNAPPGEVILTAVNTGERVVILGGLGVLLPNGAMFPLVPDSSSSEIPHRLPADEAFHAWWPASDVAKRLKAAGFTGTIQLVGYFADQRGRLYRSKRFAFDLDMWSTLKIS